MSSATPRRTGKSPKDFLRCFLPVMALDFRKLRERKMDSNHQSEFPRNFSHMASSGSRVFMVQGGRIWGGSADTMMFDKFTDIEFSVLAIEPLSDGLMVMTDKGFYYITKDMGVQRVSAPSVKSSIPKATTAGGNMVFGISNLDEVFACQMVYPENGGAPYPMVGSLTDGRLDAILWGPKPSMKFIADTLWAAREHDIYGFKNGGWTRRHDYGTKTVKMLGEFEGRLTVFFYDNPAIPVSPMIDIDPVVDQS